MAREEIEIALSADDDASRVLAELAQQSERLEADPVKVDVTADTGAAVADLGKVDDAAREADDGVKGLKGQADSSRSVLANMVGNSAQDLGELGGIAGTAGVAVGQIAEYAADGQIAIKGLLTTAVPMLALGIAVKAITDHFAAAQRKAEELKKTNQELATSLRAGQLDEAAQTIVDGYADIIDKAGEAGVSVADLTRYITGQSDELPTLTAAIAENEAAVDAQGTTYSATLGELQATGLGLQDLRGDIDNARDSLSEQSGALTTNEARQAAVRDALGDTAGAMDDTRRATEELTAAYDTLTGRLDDEASYLSAQGAIDAVNDAMADAMTATATYGAGSEEAQDANRRLAEQLNASKTDVLGYAGAVAGIPPEQATEITALIEEGDYIEAERRLAELEKQRIAHVRIETKLPTRPLGYPPNAPWPPWGATTAATASVQNVNVNLPRGSRPADTIRAFERYARRNGGTVRR